jgi:hypothetical protein
MACGCGPSLQRHFNREQSIVQTIERVIILALLKNMREAGYEPAAVWDGEEYVMAVGEAGEYRSFPAEPRLLSSQPTKTTAPATIMRPLSDAIALRAIESVDESTLHFCHRNARTWGNRGVSLILGNGVDVVCDYHSATGEPFGEVVDAIADRIDKGQLP